MCFIEIVDETRKDSVVWQTIFTNVLREASPCCHSNKSALLKKGFLKV